MLICIDNPAIKTFVVYISTLFVRKINEYAFVNKIALLASREIRNTSVTCLQNSTIFKSLDSRQNYYVDVANDEFDPK